MTATRRTLGILLAVLLAPLPLTPAAAGAEAGAPGSAAAPDGMRFGIELWHTKEAREKGFDPTYGQVWFGTWTRWGWKHVDDSLALAKAQGVTPVVEWWYWGDQISPAFVNRTATADDARSLADWRAMSTTLAKKVHAGLDGGPAVVVLESEFNKNGIVGWAPWNDHVKEIAGILRTHAPNATLILGFGDWDRTRWGFFAPAVEAVDGVGLQAMRGSTRQTDAQYLAIGQSVLDGATKMHATFPHKDVWIHDVAFSSYPDDTHRDLQAQGLRNLLGKRADLAAQRVVALVYRMTFDDPHMGLHNYYGWAERYWGLMDRDGAPKPAWDVWVQMTSPAKPPPAPVNVTGVVSLSAARVEHGEILVGNLTLTNHGPEAVTLTHVTLAARPPGGTKGGGPYLDFGSDAEVTVPAGESLTLMYVRDFTEGDPVGTWIAYPAWRNPGGAWRDGAELRFEVAPPADPDPGPGPVDPAPDPAPDPVDPGTPPAEPPAEHEPAPEPEGPPQGALPKPTVAGGRLTLAFHDGGRVVEVALPLRAGALVLR